MAGGHPRKKVRNTSGLRKGTTKHASGTLGNITDDENNQETVQYEGETHQPDITLLKPLDLAYDEDSESDLEAWGGGDHGDPIQIGEAMAEMARGLEEKDLEWLPRLLQRQVNLKKGRPKEYKKGPDVMSKSERTQRRYRKQFADQTQLDVFFLTPGIQRHNSSSQPCNRDTSPPEPPISPVPTSRTASEAGFTSEPEVEFKGPEGADHDPDGTCKTSVIDVDALSATRKPESEDGQSDGAQCVEPWRMDEHDLEAWEEELMQETILDLGNDKPPTPDWNALRLKARNELKKRTLPQSHINKLIIISNFATLLLKGVSRIQASLDIARQWKDSDGTWFARQVRGLARHWESFQTLPREKRGGNNRGLLANEEVQLLCRSWLSLQPSGKVTAQRFCAAVNGEILPTLNFPPKQSISLRTS